jgi:transposase InsO family protein
LALVVLSVVEQRLDAVRAVLAGASVTEVAAVAGVSRSSVHRWMARYLAENVAGLTDRSHRPHSSPRQVDDAVEVAVAEMRRLHPRWGAKRIRMELLRRPAEGLVVPSERTIDRILHRQGLALARPRKRPKDSYVRWERSAAMQLWQMDIVGGIELVNTATGELREAKVVTAVDDHSRFCVIAQVVERATGRAVCLAFAKALARFGVPEEIITDNGRQFTDRFGKRGEVLFDKICRSNAITHRLTQPASPNQNGKVERFHGTFRPEFCETSGPFASLEQAQAAVDAWVADYNTNRPHQALDDKLPVTPADRFTPRPDTERELVETWLPDALAPAIDTMPQESESPEPSAPGPYAGGPIEFTKVVPPSGNMYVLRRQFWLGPARAGQTVRFWADCDIIHLLIGDGRVKSVRSHLTVSDLARLVAHEGATPAGPSPLPPAEDGAAVEVDRCVSPGGTISLGNRVLVAAEILAGSRVGIRIEPTTLMFFDLDTRELLRTRPNPLSADQITKLRGRRPAGPPPRPATEPIRVQRRADDSGVIMVCGQKVALGRLHKHKTVTIAVSETTLAIELDDEDTRIVRRTTTSPVRNIKSMRPRTAPTVS